MFEQPGILPTEPIPTRSRRPAGKGEQLQEDSHRPDSVPKRGPAGFAPSASRRAHVLVVRRHVREDRIPCGRRCEAQRRGLPGNSDVTGCASPTSHRLRGRPVAATASGGRSPSGPYCTLSSLRVAVSQVNGSGSIKVDATRARLLASWLRRGNGPRARGFELRVRWPP
jgi:hypothetical protein